MDFKEWSKYNLGYTGEDAYKAGQQSKQAEIDALKNLIDEIVGIVREADLSDGNSSVAIVHDEIKELLK